MARGLLSSDVELDPFAYDGLRLCEAAVPPADAPPPPELWEPGVLEGMATEAGLTPQSAFDATWAYEYPDAEALGRAMMAPAGLGELAGPEREQPVRQAIVEALAPYRTQSGGYRLENEWHYLVARA